MTVILGRVATLAFALALGSAIILSPSAPVALAQDGQCQRMDIGGPAILQTGAGITFGAHGYAPGAEVQASVIGPANFQPFSTTVRADQDCYAVIWFDAPSSGPTGVYTLTMSGMGAARASLTQTYQFRVAARPNASSTQSSPGPTPIASSLPPSAIAPPESDCDSEYDAAFLSWMQYLTGNSDSPGRPDQNDPCLADHLQGQADAFSAWQAGSGPAQDGPPAPSAPETAQELQPSTPAPADGASYGCSDAPRLARLQGMASGPNLDRSNIALGGITPTLGGASFCAVQVSDDYIAVIAMVSNQGSRATNAMREFALRDSRGRVYQHLTSLEFPVYSTVLYGLQHDPDAAEIWAVGGGLRSMADPIQPGRAAFVLLIFQVAPDSQDLRFVSSR